MKQDGLKQILQSYQENRLSHAFLLETNNQEECFEDLKHLLCQINCEHDFQKDCDACNLCSLILKEKLPSFYVIRPDGQNVKKIQITEMKQRFSTKPIYSKYHMYVILNAEKMNSSSANVILKFLEEPEDYILGFFVTNNKENVIDTIKSRCQIFPCFYDTDEIVEENITNLSIQLLKNIHIDKDFSLLSNRFLIEEKLSKDDFQKILRYIIHIYYLFYKSKFQSDTDLTTYRELSFLSKKNSEYLLQQINLVSLLEKQLNYNANITLLLDRYVIETR